MRARDALLSSIEAAYAVDVDDRAWLEGIRSALDRAELGPWSGYMIDGRHIENVVGDYSGDFAMIVKGARSLPETMLRLAHAPAPAVECAHPRMKRVVAACGWTIEAVEEIGDYPVQRVCGLLGTDAHGTGAFLAVPAQRDLPARTRRKLGQVAAHVAAAHRLRLRLRSDAAADAICKPNGEMVEGSRAAVAKRASIALAVKNLDRARGKLRRLDPDEAVTAWSAMVDGAWSLVDQVERDGKRYVLVHRNAPNTTLTALTDMEARVATFAALGHSSKYIAYELGLAPSTVASHLAAALRKLRLKSRRELVAAYGPLARVRSAARAR